MDGIVELDDTYLGAPTQGKKRGRGTEKSKVIVVIAKKNIVEGSHIESDNFASLKKGLAGKYFVHYDTFSPDKDMLQHLHTAISNMKAFLNGTYHDVTKAHLQKYLDEFNFRYNRRKFGVHLFERLAMAVFAR